MPATNAVSERNLSALRRLNTWMGQTRLNSCFILHVHKDKTDSLSLQIMSLKEMKVVCANLGNSCKCSSHSSFNLFNAMYCILIRTPVLIYEHGTYSEKL